MLCEAKRTVHTPVEEEQLLVWILIIAPRNNQHHERFLFSCTD
jgi:hypothetical protein